MPYETRVRKLLQHAHVEVSEVALYYLFHAHENFAFWIW